MKRILFTFLSVLVAVSTLKAETPLWMRYPSISPDGKFIAFSYKGDIYKVPTQGGQAVQLTTNSGYDYLPIWSPDSQQIAFVSNRENGFMRLFIMSANGGAAQQLTFHSASVKPYVFSKDGKFIYYASNVQNTAESALYPLSRFTQLYKISVKGGTPEMILETPTEAISFNKEENKMLYQDQKGFEDTWRKHHTSSVARDIWLYDVKKKSHTKIIDWKGEDRDPIYAPDGKSFFFLSERKGSFNVFKADFSSVNQPKQLSNFTNFPVRFLSMASNGLLCFGYAGEIYTLKEGETPKKVVISVVNDDAQEQIQKMNFTSGASSVAVSSDGKQIAMVIRGEVFVTSADYTTTKQITQSVAAESGVSFSKDGRSLVYASYRDGYWNLYQASLTRKDDVNFANALEIKEEKLIANDTSEKMHPQFSPDGKEIAFVKNRSHLAVYNLETKKMRDITSDKYQVEKNGNYNFAWSPDSKWFVIEYVARGHSPYSDIGIVSSKGGEDIFNITNSGYFNSNPRWAFDGNAIIWNTDRYGMRNHASWGSMRDEMIVFLNKESFNKYQMNKEEFELYSEIEKEREKQKNQQNNDPKKDPKKQAPKPQEKLKNIVIDFENLEARMVRLTPNASQMGDAIISKDGKKLYYLASFESGYDLWVHDLREKSTKLLAKLNGESLFFDMDKDGKNIFLLGSKKMQILELPSEKLKPINYSAWAKINATKEREEMFNFVKKEVKERFYVTDLHGVNWEKLTQEYRQFLPYINNNRDFAELLSELLGELNVSHTGSGYRAWSAATEATGQLGAFVTQTEKGLVIDEILVNGPFDTFQSKAEKGVIIEKINGEPITLETHYAKFLEGSIGQKILVSLFNPKNGNRWQESLTPISTAKWNELLHKRWVKQRQADVEKWSNGKLGYVHISSMSDESFREMYADALGKYFDKEGMVIDIRFNGGGRLHEDVEVFFSAKKYLTQKVQGKKHGEMPSRRWTKPSIMLMNEADYSNAHGTPWVYKKQNLGKLVGVQVPGTMTSVNWVTLQDPSLFFGIPVVGFQKEDGSYLENDDLNPDVEAPFVPEKFAKGEDVQLKKAVEELLKELK